MNQDGPHIFSIIYFFVLGVSVELYILSHNANSLYMKTSNYISNILYSFLIGLPTEFSLLLLIITFFRYLLLLLIGTIPKFQTEKEYLDLYCLKWLSS